MVWNIGLYFALCLAKLATWACDFGGPVRGDIYRHSLAHGQGLWCKEDCMPSKSLGTLELALTLRTLLFVYDDEMEDFAWLAPTVRMVS